MTALHESLLHLAKTVLIGGPIVLGLVGLVPLVVDCLISRYWDKRP